MQKQDFYYLMAFPTTTDVMQAEAYLKEQISITIMSVPWEISSGCGLAIRFMETDEEKILQHCQTLPNSGTLYKMLTQKVDGRHPITVIAEF